MKPQQRLTTQESDKRMAQYGPLRRYTSLESAGISLTDLPVTANQVAEVQKWQGKFRKLFNASTKKPVFVPAVIGQRFNLDDYLAGEPECFRRQVIRPKTSPIKIGINLSAAYSAWSLTALRGGCILAFAEYLRKRGKSFEIEACYGNGRTVAYYGECHARIRLLPFANTVTHLALSNSSAYQIGSKIVEPLARLSNSSRGLWCGGYRLYEYEALGIKEYDFVLDRIETDNETEETERIMTRLKSLGLLD